MSGLLLQRLLAQLGERPDDQIFLGLDRITRAEFADLVWRFAGGLRKRNARSFALLAKPGPATLALLVAAVGMEVRVDLISPRGGTELVQGRLDAAAPDFVVADPGLRWLLKGPGWLRRPAGLPDWRIWPETVGIDDIGAAQVRRFGIEPDSGAVTVFIGGSAEAPLGVVHTAGSLSAGTEMLAGLFDAGGDGPVFADTYRTMLAALAVDLPIVVPRADPRRLARQFAKWRPSHTWLTARQWRLALSAGAAPRGRAFATPATAGLLARLRAAGADEAIGVFATPEVYPVAAVESLSQRVHAQQGEHVGRLFDGVEARIVDGELIFSGTSMAPRIVDGGWLDEVPIGERGALEGRDLWWQGRRADVIWWGDRIIHAGLHEPRLAVDGVDVALLVGVPTGDGDDRLAVLAQASAPSEAVRGALRRRARELGLAVEHIVFADVPTINGSDAPDRDAARAIVAERIG